MTTPDIATQALRLGELDNAWSCAELGLRETTPDCCADIWQYRFVRAEVLRIRGRFEEALESLENLGLPADADVAIVIAHDMHCGYCHGLLGHYESSTLLLERAETAASHAGLSALHCEVLLRQAMVAFLQEDYVNSGRLYRLALDECQLLDDWYLLSGAQAGIGKVLMIQREYSEAIPWFERALALAEPKQAKSAMARIWSEIAVCELGLGRPVKALELFRKAERVDLELGALPNYQVCVANIGNVYCATGDFLKAIEHYQRALKIAEEIKDPVSIRKWTHNLQVAFTQLREAAAKAASNKQ